MKGLRSLVWLTLAGTIGWIAFKWVDAHRWQHELLSDGTQIRFKAGSHFAPAPSYPRPRVLQLDGEFLVGAQAGEAPLTLRSRLLDLTVMGPSVLRVVAHSAETGEEVEVFCGNVTVKKAYESTVQELPVHLGGRDMAMVNRTIDLLEDEHFGPDEDQKLAEYADQVRLQECTLKTKD